jgi:hypothetical protein
MSLVPICVGPGELPLLHFEYARLPILIRRPDPAFIQGVGEASVVGVHWDSLSLPHGDFDDSDHLVLEDHPRRLRSHFQEVPSQGLGRSILSWHISGLAGQP